MSTIKARILGLPKFLQAVAAFCLLALGLCFSPCALAATPAKAEPVRIEDGLLQPYPAPLIIGISQWLNSPPLDLKKLRGKVVLIEFWTTSCPYCQSSLRYYNEWYSRYHNQGLEIIGVHSPKEDWEKNVSVVKGAVAENHIRYPVAIDNNFETWMSYGVNGWPAAYLIDQQGNIVYVNVGAANFNIVEDNIKALLRIKS